MFFIVWKWCIDSNWIIDFHQAVVEGVCETKIMPNDYIEFIKVVFCLSVNN
jgi:hypothetical protein